MSPAWAGMLSFCSVFTPSCQRLLEARAIGKGPGHLCDPAIFPIPPGTTGRINLGVPIHQADLSDAWFLREA